MQSDGGGQSAAGTVDRVLRELMPKPDGVMTMTEVAKVCGCAPATPRAWLLNYDGQVSVPRGDGRTKLLSLVREKLGDGPADTLASAWSRLLGPTSPVLDEGDDSSESVFVSALDDGELTRNERQLIVEQAQVVLSEAYAHLPFKRALHAVDPIQRLRLLGYRLSLSNEELSPEVAFHREMIDIFTSLRDRHTSYVLPTRFRKAIALLPFRVEQYFAVGEGGERTAVFLASKVDREVSETSSFVAGVVLSHWNGIPIQRAVELLAESQGAGNAPAAFARALDALTLRPLLSTMAPDESWVDVTYTDLEGNATEHRFIWERRDAPADMLGDHITVAMGIDAETDSVSSVRKEMYGRKNSLWSASAEEEGPLAEPIAIKSHHVETHMPWSFRAHTTLGQDGRIYGYLRIFSFKTRKPADFIAEFGRLCSVLPDNGLVVDVRGNAGGSIVAAEGSLRVLAKVDKFRPCRAQFTTSPLMLGICERHSGKKGKKSRFGLQLEPWIRTLSQAVATGSQYSGGFPITPDAVLDNITDRYPGAVVLIVGGLCYSATDMFAAGFTDHEIGPVVGTADNTGAGGANVWRHSDLVKLAGPNSDVKKLPHGIDFRFAVRRTTRVRSRESEILEDLGIEIADGDRHYMTLPDLIDGNKDLYAFAASRLK